ncbi:hypothetical protein SALBM311S_02311 [Streptomyces alboniger]
MLLQAGVSRVGYIRAQLDPVRSGLAVSGPGAAAKVRKLREEGFPGPLLADPAVYTVAAASEDGPFPDVSEGQLSFGDPLRLSIEERVGHRAGATAAMTPTGYLHAEDSDALKAAVHQILKLEDSHVFQAAKRSPGGPNSPSVLLPELMDFFLGETLAKRFAAGLAPVCRCAACDGLVLDTFVSNHWQVPAAAHNAAVLMEWLRTMDAVEPAGRPAWWQQRCQRAVDRYPVLNAELDHPGFSAFKVPQQLLQWAQASVAPQASSTARPVAGVERGEP